MDLRSPRARNLFVCVGERLDQLRRELAGVDRLRPAIQPHRQVLADLYLELATVELDDDRAGGAKQEGGDRGAAGPGSRGERLPHPALEDPRPHPAAVDGEETDVGAIGEQLAGFDLGPDRFE